MSRFFFSRPESTQTDVAPGGRPDDGREVRDALAALAQIQSITASAIFAALVSKGVLTPDEAAAYMGEIAGALEIDVASPVAADAADVLRSYGRALSAAGG